MQCSEQVLFLTYNEIIKNIKYDFEKIWETFLYNIEDRGGGVDVQNLYLTKLKKKSLKILICKSNLDSSRTLDTLFT